jgi:hypothetical protein
MRIGETAVDASQVGKACRGRSAVPPSRVVIPLLMATGLIGTAGLAVVLLHLSIGEQVAVWVAAGLAALVTLHRALLSLVAGLALAVIRPYASGEPLRLHSPAHGGEVEAVIVRLGLLNTTLATETGLLCLPNHRLLMDAPQPAVDR